MPVIAQPSPCCSKRDRGVGDDRLGRVAAARRARRTAPSRSSPRARRRSAPPGSSPGRPRIRDVNEYGPSNAPEPNVHPALAGVERRRSTRRGLYVSAWFLPGFATVRADEPRPAPDLPRHRGGHRDRRRCPARRRRWRRYRRAGQLGVHGRRRPRPRRRPARRPRRDRDADAHAEAEAEAAAAAGRQGEGAELQAGRDRPLPRRQRRGRRKSTSTATTSRRSSSRARSRPSPSRPPSPASSRSSSRARARCSRS